MNNEIKVFNNNSLERYKKFVNNYYSSKHSIENRVSAVKKFISFLNNKNRKIDTIDHSSVEEFLTEELDGSISIITVQNYYSYLKGFFHYLKEQNDNITMNYDKVNFDRVKYFNVEVFTDAEIAEIFKIIDQERNEKIKLSNYIIFKLLFYTGCTLKELYSIKVFQSSADIYYDEDNYLALDTKEVYFRYPIQRKFKLHDSIINDIRNYHKIMEKLVEREMPRIVPLILSNYDSKDSKKKITELKYSSIQNRMTAIKKKSSFANKDLSLKNIRHTLIYKMIDNGKPLEFISNIGIDISTLKMYLKENEKDCDIDYFYKEHPYLSILF